MIIFSNSHNTSNFVSIFETMDFPYFIMFRVSTKIFISWWLLFFDFLLKAK